MVKKLMVFPSSEILNSMSQIEVQLAHYQNESIEVFLYLKDAVDPHYIITTIDLKNGHAKNNVIRYAQEAVIEFCKKTNQK